MEDVTLKPTEIETELPPVHLLEQGPQTSAHIDKLVAALAKAQSKMLTVMEDSTNPHFGSGYASLAAVRKACAPLSEQGVAILQIPHGSKRLFTLLCLGDQWLSCCTAVEPQRAGPQAYGSALTYARRYALMSLLGLAPDDDDGNEAQAPPQRSQAAPRQQRPREVYPAEGPTPEEEELHEKPKPKGWSPSDAQLKRLFAIAKSAGVDMEDIRTLMRQMWKLGSTRQLSKGQYDQLCNDLIPQIAAGGDIMVDTSMVSSAEPDPDVPF